MSDDFYIGYLDESPRPLARRTRALVAGLAGLVVGLVAVLAARQTPAESGTFEFGVKRAFEGVLYETPLPFLRSVSIHGATTNYLLVGFGKKGLPTFARNHHGAQVRFNGTLIQRGSAVMVEMNDEKSFTVLGLPAQGMSLSQSEAIGEVELTGELVDTKCYLGVMRPATGKVHRACAVRCLSGGVPPGLLVRDGDGGAVAIPLTGQNGKQPALDVQWAGRAIKVAGTLTLRDGLPILQATRIQLAD